MRKIFKTPLIILLWILCCSASGFAYEKGLGLGVIIGEPTGISLKKWFNQKSAIDGAVAWSFGHEDALHLHGDYLFHNRTTLHIDRTRIPFYYGIGARFKFEKESRVGIRFPLGITFFIVEAPIDLFLEVVPILNLAPSTDLDLNAALGIRYYFH